MTKKINIDGVEYNLVPVPSTQEVTKEPKPQTKYRKNGALVFAPKDFNRTWFVTHTFRVTRLFLPYKTNTIEETQNLFSQGLVFDNKEACQLWADKLKIAYALKQKIVESESQDEYLEYCYISFNAGIEKSYVYQATNSEVLCVSANAKDILMSDDISDEEFKVFIEVFSN